MVFRGRDTLVWEKRGRKRVMGNRLGTDVVLKKKKWAEGMRKQ